MLAKVRNLLKSSSNDYADIKIKTKLKSKSQKGSCGGGDGCNDGCDDGCGASSCCGCC